MSDHSSHRGHCRCGSIIMSANGEPNFAVFCHCDDCKRATGSPVLASVAFDKASIVWEATDTLARHTMGTATRLFCNQCGSPVAQEHESASDRTFFNTGFMDEPENYPPTAHTFARQQLSWLKLDDNLHRAETTLLITTN